MVLVKNPSPTRGLSPQRENGNTGRSKGQKFGGRGSRGNSPGEPGSRGNSPGKSGSTDIKGKRKNVLLQSRGNEWVSCQPHIEKNKRVENQCIDCFTLDLYNCTYVAFSLLGIIVFCMFFSQKLLFNEILSLLGISIIIAC